MISAAQRAARARARAWRNRPPANGPLLGLEGWKKFREDLIAQEQRALDNGDGDESPTVTIELQQPMVVEPSAHRGSSEAVLNDGVDEPVDPVVAAYMRLVDEQVEKNEDRRPADSQSRRSSEAESNDGVDDHDVAAYMRLVDEQEEKSEERRDSDHRSP